MYAHYHPAQPRNVTRRTGHLEQSLLHAWSPEWAPHYHAYSSSPQLVPQYRWPGIAYSSRSLMPTVWPILAPSTGVLISKALGRDDPRSEDNFDIPDVKKGRNWYF